MVRAVDQGAIAGATDGASDGSGVVQGAIEVATDGASAGSLSNGRSNRWRKWWIIELCIMLCIIYTLKTVFNFFKIKLRHHLGDLSQLYISHKYVLILVRINIDRLYAIFRLIGVSRFVLICILIWKLHTIHQYLCVPKLVRTVYIARVKLR